MGSEAFKWTFIIAFVVAFIFTIFRTGGDFWGSLIAALFLGTIAAGVVSMGADKISGRI